MKLYKRKLTAHDTLRDDVYRDTVRVHWQERGSIKHGAIVKVSVNGQDRLLAMRGLGDDKKGQILLDFVTRGELGVKENIEYEFAFSKVGLVGRILWASRASDPAARIATGIAIWSAIPGTALGLLGLGIGIWPLLK